MSAISCAALWLPTFALLSSLWLVSAIEAAKPGPAGTQPYGPADLLVAFPTHEGNVALIDLSRPWRRRVRTHILIDQSLDLRTLRELGYWNNESYSATPDFRRHSHAVRHALTPLFALDAVGADLFKWMLVGDDHTIFVIPAVLRLLNEAGLAADDPHLISDFHYECQRERHGNCSAPHSVDPRCRPCPLGSTRPCPCRLPRDCTRTDSRARHCPFPQHVWPYGGAGVIFSVGMVRLLAADPKFYMPMVLKHVTTIEPAGDKLLAEGPRLLGFGYTNIGNAGLPAVTNVTGGVAPKPRRFFHTYGKFNERSTPREVLERLEVAAIREPEVFRRMVSFHIRTRIVGNQHHDLVREVIPAYQGILDLLVRTHGSLDHTISSLAM